MNLEGWSRGGGGHNAIRPFVSCFWQWLLTDGRQSQSLKRYATAVGAVSEAWAQGLMYVRALGMFSGFVPAWDAS